VERGRARTLDLILVFIAVCECFEKNPATTRNYLGICVRIRGSVEVRWDMRRKMKRVYVMDSKQK
jgi:hypothetical protein